MSHPITGIGFVTSLSRVPSHCTAVKLTKDTHEDADIGKENLLRKSSRYLVYEKKPCSQSSPHNVLVELVIVTSRDAVPIGFTIIERTLDTRERCIKGKHLCAKFEKWTPHMTAITDVMIFKNAGDSLRGHILVGELTDQRILACVQSDIGSSANAGDNSLKKRAPAKPAETPRKSQIYSPMCGVPFELTRDCRIGDADDIMSRYSVHPKSRETIEDEYSYNFTLEKSLVAG
ncbi:unnamed protein product [Mesocestoides corti]|uniref:MABP domain-containing protein n=1 Tax=Mesocestoides corti TaxID=53468 RepID=A0A0R3UKZ8_MESCO|nr:unnamed protein product [Mesocestoides corti]